MLKGRRGGVILDRVIEFKLNKVNDKNDDSS